MTDMRLSRRSIMLGGASLLATWASLPGVALSSTETRDPRLLIVILRGALDGLAFAAPVGDPAYASARGELVFANGLPLDGMFTLNPNMPGLKAMYDQKEALLSSTLGS